MNRWDTTLRRGLTLAEMVVSMVAMSILVGGMASAIILASKALPENGSALDGMVNAGLALEQVTSELLCTNEVTEGGATAITIVVPDEDADGNPETIRYAWSGTAGDPLTRKYNSRKAVDFLANVQSFNVEYILESATVEEIGPETESGEIPLAWHTSLGISGNFKIEQSKWLGQYFKPDTGALPTDSLKWSLTRVSFQARQESPANDSIRVQIRTADGGGMPTSTILAEKVLAESSLPTSYSPIDVSFATLTGLAPDVGLCLVVAQTTTSGSGGRLIYDNLGGEGLLLTTNAGSTWATFPTRAMYFVIYGNVTIAGQPQDVTYNYVKGVRITLQAGEGTDDCLETAVQLVNVPELSG